MLLQSLIMAFGLLPSALAIPEFSNYGEKSGWPAPQPTPEALGKVSEVTNVVFRGPTALKMEQTYQPGYKGRYHSESVVHNGYRRGETKFYGFAFRLQDNWEFDPPQSYNIAQWIADYGDTGCDDWSPTSMVWLEGRTLYTRIKTGQLLPGKPCPAENNKCDCSGGKNCQCTSNPPIRLAGDVQGGVWYRLTFQVKWESDGTGFFKTWVNGTKVYEKFDIPTTLLDDRRPLSFRVGLYANGWHDQGQLKGNQPFRQVWIDEVGIGSEFKDADPERL